MRAWERLEGESEKAYRAFSIYRDLSPEERSIDRAYQLYSGEQKGGKRAASYFWRWSADFDWTGRVQALEDYHEMLISEEIEKRAHEKAKELAEISAEVAERTLRAKLEYLDRVETMAKWPIQEAVTTDDGKTVIIRPAKWTFATLNQALQLLANDPSARRNLAADQEWIELRDTILAVLDDFPEAREALVRALAEEG